MANGFLTLLFSTTARSEAKSTAARIPDAELDALLDLYHSTNGPTWRKNRWPKEVAAYQSGGTEAGRRRLELGLCAGRRAADRGVADGAASGRR